MSYRSASMGFGYKMQTVDDTPLLRTIADIFGQSKWFKAIVALIQDNNVVVVAQQSGHCTPLMQERDLGGLKLLQFDEAFDPPTGSSKVPSMPFSKAQVLPAAFIADSLKPTATGLTSYSEWHWYQIQRDGRPDQCEINFRDCERLKLSSSFMSFLLGVAKKMVNSVT
ncbi:hypothetical protein Tco_0866857, partial [Tanacetum coccineum]